MKIIVIIIKNTNNKTTNHNYNNKDSNRNISNKKDNLRTTKTQNRYIVWFNSPYIKNVVAKIVRYFLKFVEEHFFQYHKLRKVFQKIIQKLFRVACLQLNQPLNH